MPLSPSSLSTNQPPPPPPSFASLQEEASYWKVKSCELEKKLAEIRDEFDDFQLSSRELEEEMEAQLKQLESRNKELVGLVEKVTSERDHYRQRFEGNQVTMTAEVTTLQDNLTLFAREKDQLQRYIRELEQGNDDLERSKRAAVATLTDFESRLNDAIEHNAMLENELEEREELNVTVQRLKDEIRDLRNESRMRANLLQQPGSPSMVNGPAPMLVPLDVAGSRLPQSANNVASASSLSPPTLVRRQDSRLLQQESLPSAATDTGLHDDGTGQSNLQSTPSLLLQLNRPVRLAALGMVNDALQKIARLESRLTTLYRAYGSDNNVVVTNRGDHLATCTANQQDDDGGSLLTLTHQQPWHAAASTPPSTNGAACS